MTNLPFPLLLMQSVLVLCKLLERILDEREKVRERKKRQLGACVALYCVTSQQTTPRKKRRYLPWDRQRAADCIAKDYLGPVPLFDDKQFQRIFRISKDVYNVMKRECALNNKFFCDEVRLDAAGKKNITIDAKLLIALKFLAYGCSVNTFLDYFQMGESTANKCVHEFVKTVSNSDLLNSIYLRQMSRTNAKKVCDLHKTVHGIHGMVGSLDCLHIPWKNCPVAHEGSFIGSKGESTIILEACADHNLWIWHACFGFPGAMNDINVFNASSLHADYLNGTYEHNTDFEYKVDGETFNLVYMLVDGIYPKTARFVKTKAVTVSEKEKRFASWQESARKDVERAFGVLVRRFMILDKGIEFWHLHEIKQLIATCLIMHNMMVEYRINTDIDMFDLNLPFVTFDESDTDEPTLTAIQMQQQESELRRREEILATHEAMNFDVVDLELCRQRRRQQYYSESMLAADRRYLMLYDNVQHDRLTNSIMNELDNNYLACINN